MSPPAFRDSKTALEIKYNELYQVNRRGICFLLKHLVASIQKPGAWMQNIVDIVPEKIKEHSFQEDKIGSSLYMQTTIRLNHPRNCNQLLSSY